MSGSLVDAFNRCPDALAARRWALGGFASGSVPAGLEDFAAAYTEVAEEQRRGFRVWLFTMPPHYGSSAVISTGVQPQSSA